MKKLEHPSLLSFTRSHNVSVFPFYGAPSGENSLFQLSSLQPVILSRETIRGSQAAAVTKEKDRGVPNIQRVDFASLPHGTDMLVVEGNLRVAAEALKPNACNDKKFEAALQEFIAAFDNAGGFRELAERYVMSLVNGSILFRNQLGANIRVALRYGEKALEVSRDRDLSPGVALTLDCVANPVVKEELAELVDAYAAALAGKRSVLFLEVRAAAVFGEGQEVYPSQEFAENQDKGEGRVLARAPRVDILQAAFHGRKVANALRTIDTWYPNATKPLPVEPFAPDQSTQTAMRGDKSDFYSLLLQMPEMTAQLQGGDVTSNSLFVVAVLIRGGVFSKKKE